MVAPNESERERGRGRAVASLSMGEQSSAAPSETESEREKVHTTGNRSVLICERTREPQQQQRAGRQALFEGFFFLSCTRRNVRVCGYYTRIYIQRGTGVYALTDEKERHERLSNINVSTV